MGGDTGQLQRLTDQQVSARLAAYNPDGSLDRDLKLFKDHMLELVVAEIGTQFGPDRADHYSSIYSGKIDATWIQAIAEYGRQIYRDKTSVPDYIADRFDIANRVFSALTEQFRNDSQQLANCISA
jgi:methyl-accepting chemotaxis protein